jgi:hypothetical protein
VVEVNLTSAQPARLAPAQASEPDESSRREQTVLGYGVPLRDLLLPGDGEVFASADGFDAVADHGLGALEVLLVGRFDADEDGVIERPEPAGAPFEDELGVSVPVFSLLDGRRLVEACLMPGAGGDAAATHVAEVVGELGEVALSLGGLDARFGSSHVSSWEG